MMQTTVFDKCLFNHLWHIVQCRNKATEHNIKHEVNEHMTQDQWYPTEGLQVTVPTLSAEHKQSLHYILYSTCTKR